MLFSAPTFLFVFLPVVLAAFMLLPRRLRTPFLVLVSLLFYAWGEKQIVLLLAASIVVNWTLGLLLHRQTTIGARRAVLAIGAVLNLGALLYFKYTNLLVSSVDAVRDHFGASPMGIAPVALPIGISFVTFEALSYLFDVYRRDIEPARNPFHVAFYISFFPHLIAGPIVRYGNIAPQVTAPAPDLERFASGVGRFITGLAKKLIIANTVAASADVVFGADPSTLTVGSAWLGVVAYTLQIYFDFSGYSDMAIGLGRMFGFELPENFNLPYCSQSVKEFWRRWHMSLSTWFRDYVYVPLGGNRVSPARTYGNLVLVFLLCGLWHGASWSFVLWGAYHGLFLVLERLRWGRLVGRLPSLARHLYTMLVVSMGWVLFRAESFDGMVGYFKALVGRSHPAVEAAVLVPVSHELVVTLVVGVILATIPRQAWRERISIPRALQPLGSLVMLGMFLVTLLYLAGSTYDPFIYFRF